MIAAVWARCAALRVTDDASFGALAFGIIGEVPRQVRTLPNAKHVAAAECASPDVAAMLLLANERSKTPPWCGRTLAAPWPAGEPAQADRPPKADQQHHPGPPSRIDLCS